MLEHRHRHFGFLVIRQTPHNLAREMINRRHALGKFLAHFSGDIVEQSTHYGGIGIAMLAGVGLEIAR